MNSQSFKIRQGTKADIDAAFNLICELAEYEKAADQVTNSPERMLKDGFGENPAFGFFVLLENDVIVGLSLYFDRYSTWKGRRLYLEDIIITESCRAKGYGKKLLDHTLAFAKASGYTGMTWQVLDWNEPAINFYKKNYKVRLDAEWLNCNVEFE